MRGSIREPLVLQQPISGRTAVLVDRQASADKVLGRIGHVGPVRRGLKFVVPPHDRARFFFLGVSVKGCIPAQQEIGDDTDRPNIDGLAVSNWGSC